MFRKPVILFLILLLACLPLRAADSLFEVERLQKLERAVQQLQQRNTELEQEIKGLKKQSAFAPEFDAYGNKKPEVASDGKTYVEKTAAEEKPPVDVHPGGSEYKLTLGGYIQANFEDGAVSAFEGRFPNGPNQVKDRFRLRRARINLTGDFAEKFDFKIEGDFGVGDGLATGRTGFSATDIFVNWHQYPEANIKAGQWKAPFGLENLTPDTQILTIERSLPTGALVPERQIGAMIWGKPLTNIVPEQKDLVTYYAGVFNGNGRNFTTNDNNEFMYVGRVELLPFKGQLFGQEAQLKLGADYLYSRDENGTTISPALNLKVNADGSLTPFVLTSAAERSNYSVDAALKVGPFDLSGEFLDSHITGRTVGGVAPIADFEANGWYVQGSYFVIPKKLQALVKWETLDPGQVANDDIHSITGGLNYYIHGDGIKLMANYVHTWSDFRKAHPQFGDDQFDEVLMRLQVMF